MPIFSFRLEDILLLIQHSISVIGAIIILSGVVLALLQYASYLIRGKLASDSMPVNTIRLNLGRILMLGLEFIVAADLISTTTAPDYYSVGIVAIVVVIRTFLSYSLNREIMSLGTTPR